MAYKGDEIKFSIDLTAEGFSMDDDDFDIEVRSPSRSVKGYKNPPAGEENLELIIYREASDGVWYCILDTSGLGVGTLGVVATAYVPDAHANDGIRTLIAKAVLGKLEAP